MKPITTIIVGLAFVFAILMLISIVIDKKTMDSISMEISEGMCASCTSPNSTRNYGGR
jgi:hypothetical protein